MKRIFIIVCLSLLLVACKNKEARVYDLVQNYNANKEIVTNAKLKHTKAYILDKKTIGLDFIFDSKEETFKEPYISELSIILSELDKAYPECKKLMTEGMNFKVRTYNAFGIRTAEYPLVEDSNGIVKADI